VEGIIIWFLVKWGRFFLGEIILMGNLGQGIIRKGQFLLKLQVGCLGGLIGREF
jgi:hypothetical protein